MKGAVMHPKIEKNAQKVIDGSIIAIIAIPPLLFHWATTWLLMAGVGYLAFAKDMKWFNAEYGMYANRHKWVSYNRFNLMLGVLLVSVGVIRMFDFGLALLLLPVLISVSSDSCAQIGGTVIGGPKVKALAERSANKTWSGYICGTIGGTYAGSYVWQWQEIDEALGVVDWLKWPVSLVLTVLSLRGDLYASDMKRSFNAKDFGTSLHSHGGVLDRVDGYIWTVTAMCCFSLVSSIAVAMM